MRVTRGGLLVIGLGCALLAGVWGGLLADRLGYPDPAWVLVGLLLAVAGYLIGRATR
jgi:hypothetical protein